MTGRWAPALCLFAIAGASGLAGATWSSPHAVAALQCAAAFAVLGAWACVIALGKKGLPGVLRLSVVPGIWLQPLAQGAVILYWSFHFPDVHAQMATMLLQLFFAGCVDALSNWRSRDLLQVSTSNLPIIFSLNLFLWHDDAHLWHGLAIVAAAVLSKSLLRWNQKGWAHIFNPTGIALAAAGVVYYAFNMFPEPYLKVDEALLLGPNTTEVVFLAGFLVQWRFGTAPMTLAGLGALLAGGYLAPRFGLENAPAACEAQSYIGLTLLMTDPATSPRGLTGRVLYGAAWGALFVVIQVSMVNGLGHQYAYFSKIFATPLANLLAPGCDRLAARWLQARPAWSETLTSPVWPRVAMAALALVFPLVWSSESKKESFEEKHHAVFKLAHPTPIQRVAAGGRVYCSDNPVFCRPFSFGEEWALWSRAAAR